MTDFMKDEEVIYSCPRTDYKARGNISEVYHDRGGYQIYVQEVLEPSNFSVCSAMEEGEFIWGGEDYLEKVE